jgi:hypothetical protein
MKNISYIIIAILILSNNILQAQTRTKRNNGDTLRSDVIVVRAYDPTVPDASKIIFQPKISDSVNVNVKFNYYINAPKANAEFEIIPIKSAKMLPEPLKKLYQSNITLAYGNYNTPLIEYSFNSLRSKKYNLAIHLKHQSSTGKISLENLDNKVFAGYSDNLASIKSKFFVDFHRVLETEAGFGRNVIHNYGFNTNDYDNIEIPGNDKFKQRYWNAGLKLKYYNNYTDKQHLNYNTSLSYNYLENLQAFYQHSIKFDATLNKYLNKELLGADINFYYYGFTGDSAKITNRTNFGFKPWVKVGNKRWGLKAGLNLIADTYQNNINYHFYPNVHFHYSMVDKLMTYYASINGKKEINHYEKIIRENPFITPNLQITNTNHMLDANMGLQGKVSKTLSYNFGVNYSIINNMYFFVNDTNNLFEAKYDNTFTVEYDNVLITSLIASINWEKNEKWNFNLKGEYFQYKMDTLQKAWHKPEYIITLNTIYNLSNKILINFDIFTYGIQYAKNMHTNKIIKLKGTVDINTALEYRYNKLWSAFLKLNNIAAINYNRWNQYPTQGFNVLFGLSYSF